MSPGSGHNIGSLTLSRPQGTRSGCIEKALEARDPPKKACTKQPDILRAPGRNISISCLSCFSLGKKERSESWISYRRLELELELVLEANPLAARKQSGRARRYQAEEEGISGTCSLAEHEWPQGLDLDRRRISMGKPAASNPQACVEASCNVRTHPQAPSETSTSHPETPAKQTPA